MQDCRTSDSISATANVIMDTIFLAVVRSGREKLVATILCCDQHAHSVIDFPLVRYQIPNVLYLHIVFPYLDSYQAATLRGSNCDIGYMVSYYKSIKNYLDLAYHPVESAMTNGDNLVHLLVRLGASVNIVPLA